MVSIEEMHVDEIVRRIERWLEWAEKERKNRREVEGIRVLMTPGMVAGSIALKKPDCV